MNKNTWYGLVFFLIFLGVSLWKWWAWVIWKYLDLRKDKQVFDLIGKNRFIEITGPAGKGKSWLLCHLFKNLNGVKFTNMPTSQGKDTLTKTTLDVHMARRWAAPNRFYYFLDDVEKFQKWGKKQFGHHGYKELREYISQISKCGGTFIWTNNGIEPEHIFKTQKNETWTVLGNITFMDYSLLMVKKGSYWINLIPINNREMADFYDNHWNIPKYYQDNYLRYINSRLKGDELGDIIDMVKNKKSDKNAWTKEMELKWQDIQKYNKLRSIEEAGRRAQKEKFSEEQKKLKRYAGKTTPLTFKDIDKFDKQDKKERTKNQMENPKQVLKNLTSEKGMKKNKSSQLNNTKKNYAKKTPKEEIEDSTDSENDNQENQE